MSNSIEGVLQAGVGRAQQALKLSRMAISSPALSRLVTVGRRSGAFARLVTRGGRGVWATGRVGTGALVTATRSVLPRSSRSSDPSHSEFKWPLALASSNVTLGSGRVDAVARAAGGAAQPATFGVLQQQSQNQRGLALRGMARGAVGYGSGRLEDTMPAGNVRSGFGINMRASAPARVASSTPFSLGRISNSVAPVRDGRGAVLRSSPAVPVRGAPATSTERDTGQGWDMQRWMNDRFARQASRPPASAGGFDTGLGPDWYGIGSFG